MPSLHWDIFRGDTDNQTHAVINGMYNEQYLLFTCRAVLPSKEALGFGVSAQWCHPAVGLPHVHAD